MPSFSAPSSIRVASQDHVLRLKITHNLVHGSPSDVVHSVKGRLPKELDVLWLSDISISFSGLLDGDDIPAHEIARSGLARHLQTRLKANADRLGLNNVSRPFVDDADGLSKLTLTPSRPLPGASRPHANLVSFHLAYIWRTVVRRNDPADAGHLVEEVNPFSPTLFLPAEALLNRVTEQFLTYHLVSRYPLIFGPWCKRLDLEMEYFPSISHSIVEIMTRSQPQGFVEIQTSLKGIINMQIARRQHKFVLQTATAALSTCTDEGVSETSEEEIDQLPATPVLTDDQILCDGLEQLFRIGVPQRRFKPAARVAPRFVPLPQDDDDGLLQCIPAVGIDEEDSWVELPEIAMSPSPLEVDSPPLFPEEVDVFSQEDLFEGGMWRLHGADVGLDERKFDAQSDESLICGPISLASISTRSPQADPVALYHHQADDHGELDPASSGLRYKVSQLTYLEDAGRSAVFADLIRSPSHETHDHYYSKNHGQVMGCQVDSEWFQTLDGLSDRGEVADSDSMQLFELDVPERAVDVTDFDEALV